MSKKSKSKKAKPPVKEEAVIDALAKAKSDKQNKGSASVDTNADKPKPPNEDIPPVVDPVVRGGAGGKLGKDTKEEPSTNDTGDVILKEDEPKEVVEERGKSPMIKVRTELISNAKKLGLLFEGNAESNVESFVTGIAASIGIKVDVAPMAYEAVNNLLIGKIKKIADKKKEDK